MAIRHIKTANNPESPLLTASDWNADHTAPDIADVTGLQAALDSLGNNSSAIAQRVSNLESTTWLNGFEITLNVDPAKINIASGNIRRVVGGVSTDLFVPAVTGLVVTNLATKDSTTLAIDAATLSVVQDDGLVIASQLRNLVLIGSLGHPSRTAVDFIIPFGNVNPTSPASDIGEFSQKIGIINSGNVLSGNLTTPNKINKSAGTAWQIGLNRNNLTNPNELPMPSLSAPQMVLIWRNAGQAITDTITFNRYDDGSVAPGATPSGVVATNKWTIMIFNAIPPLNLVGAEYGQVVYNTLSEAINALNTATVVNPATTTSLRLGKYILRGGGSDLNNPADAVFFPAAAIGGAGSAASLASTGTLQTAYNNDVSPQITTSALLGAVTFRRGSGADTDNVFRTQNGAGVDTFAVTGLGAISSSGSLRITGPGELLRLQNNDSNLAFYTTAGARIGFIRGLNTDIIIQADAGNFTFAAQGNSVYTVQTNSVERYRANGTGQSGIGVSNPTAALHLKAGTTTASTAPLKFTSGSLMTTAEAGAVEFLNDSFFGTITTGAARRTFAFLESPSFTTQITSPLVIGGTGTTSKLTHRTTTGVGATGADHIFQVGNNGSTEALRILNDGKILKGFPTSITNVIPCGFQINGTGGDAFLNLNRWSNNPANPAVILGKSRGATIGTFGIVSNNDNAGELVFSADDGVAFQYIGQIKGSVDGTPSAGNMPGRIVFSTTRAGGATIFEALRINNQQACIFAADVQFNKTITATGTNGAQTINKTAGSVNFAAGASSLVVTNSLVTTSSVIICTLGTNDTTMKSVSATAAAGSFTINSNAAATAATRVNFIVIN